MKNILIILVLFTGFSMNAYTPPLWEPENSCLSREADSHCMVITIVSESVRQDLEFRFASEEELLKFDLTEVQNALIAPDLAAEDCKVSVTVKVSVGIGANYVQASATISGVSCSAVVSTIQRLRQDLMDAIK